MSGTILALSTVALLCASSQIAFADESGTITGGVGGAVAGAVVGGPVGAVVGGVGGAANDEDHVPSDVEVAGRGHADQMVMA